MRYFIFSYNINYRRKDRGCQGIQVFNLRLKFTIKVRSGGRCRSKLAVIKSIENRFKVPWLWPTVLLAQSHGMNDRRLADMPIGMRGRSTKSNLLERLGKTIIFTKILGCFRLFWNGIKILEIFQMLL